MRTRCLLAAVSFCLGGYLSTPALAGEDRTLDMWQTPIDLDTGMTAEARKIWEYDHPIMGPAPVFGDVGRLATIAQPDTTGQDPMGRGTEAFTGPGGGPSGGSLFFMAHDSHGMLALDYQFENAVMSDGVSLLVRNAGMTDFTIALFVERQAPMIGPLYPGEPNYTATWDFASSAVIPSYPGLMPYQLDTNYEGDIFGILVVYNPRNDLLLQVQNSMFNSGTDMFEMNEESIEAELCCATVPAPSCVALLGLGGVVCIRRRRTV